MRDASFVGDKSGHGQYGKVPAHRTALCPCFINGSIPKEGVLIESDFAAAKLSP
jgi:hypothetical protein